MENRWSLRSDNIASGRTVNIIGSGFRAPSSGFRAFLCGRRPGAAVQ
jgi:hypothetical protein